MTRLVVGVDLGTSSVKALALSEEGRIVAKGRAQYPSLTPQLGWIEQSPTDWWDAVIRALQRCLAKVDARQVVGLGFSGHMSVLLPLDTKLHPLRAALTIADARGAEAAAWLNTVHRRDLAEATGNLGLTAFTLPKLLWYRANEPRLFNQTRVIVGAKDFLTLKTTGSLGTEPTEAGNTLLFNTNTRTWNTPLADHLGVTELLPPLRESLDLIGSVTRSASIDLGLPQGIPVIAGLADMSASVLGAEIAAGNRVALTLGTAGQLTKMVKRPDADLLGRFTYHPHALPGTMYVLASLFTGGLGLQWFTDVLSLNGLSALDIKAVLGAASTSPPGARGVHFVPHLTGSGSPDFGPQQTATLFGLTRRNESADIARAVLEGVAYSVRHCLELLNEHHAPIQAIVFGGGGLQSPLWQQIMADVTGYDMTSLAELDVGPLGTATAVATALGWEASEHQKTDVEPIAPNRQSSSVYDRGFERYLSLLKLSKLSGETH